MEKDGGMEPIEQVPEQSLILRRRRGRIQMKRGICALCRKENTELQQHHAVNKPGNIIMICGTCHKLINEGELPQ
jgi:hypothetical protein